MANRDIPQPAAPWAPFPRSAIKCRHTILPLLIIATIIYLAGCNDAAKPKPPPPPTPAKQDGAYHMNSLSSFEGSEEPKVKWDLTANHAIAQEAGYSAFSNVAPGAVRMTLRFRGNWWDGDQSTDRHDRQRAEVKGLGPHQKDGQTFEYATTWRTDPDFTDPANLTTVSYTDPIQKRRRHFCHVFQLKATDGDDGPPLVTVSVEDGDKTAAIDYWPGTSTQPIVVRTFDWTPGAWTHVAIRIKVSKTDGLVRASINGDNFSGVQGVPVFRPESDDYRPKWGLYRAVGAGAPVHDDWVEHKDVTVQRLDMKN